MVLASILANQDRSAALLNLILLLPPTLFVAVLLRPPFPRGQEVAVVQAWAPAAGVAAVFMEVHQDPDHAPSDGPNMVKLKDFPALLEQLVEIDAVVKRR